MEFDRPNILLLNPNSNFTALVEQTGPGEMEHLRALAINGINDENGKQTCD